MTTDIHTLLGAYVLDAVDDLERAAFDRHLRDCPDCRAEVTDLRDAATRLADGAWSVPPPGLRHQVLAEVSRTRQMPPRPEAGTRRPTSGRWRLTVAAAVVVAAVGTGATTYLVQDQRVRASRADAEAARADAARIQAILSAPDRVLREQPVRGGGRVTVVSSRLHGAGVIMLAAGAAPPAGRVFELWSVRATGAATPIVALDEGASSTVRVVEGLPDASAVGVTVEPPGGSRQPTQPPAALVVLT